MRRGATAVMVLTLSVSAFAADPFVGTWKLNEKESKTSSGQTPTGRITTYESIPNGLRFSIQGEDGKPADQAEFVFDGKAHATTSSPLVRGTGADTAVYVRPSSHEIKGSLKRQGNEVATTNRRVSDDGKVLTSTADGVNIKGEKFRNVLVYDKQ